MTRAATTRLQPIPDNKGGPSMKKTIAGILITVALVAPAVAEKMTYQQI